MFLVWSKKAIDIDATEKIQIEKSLGNTPRLIYID